MKQLPAVFARLGLPALGRVVPEFKPYSRRIIILLVLGIAIAAIQPLCIKLTQDVIDNLKLGTENDSIRKVPLALVGLFAAAGIAKYAYNTIRRFVLESILAKWRNRLFAQFASLPLSRLDLLKSGDLLSKLQNDLAQIGTGLETFFDVLREPFTFLGLVLTIFYCDWRLALCAFAAAPLVILLFDRSGLAVKRYSEKSLRWFSDLVSLSQETLQGSRIVKVFRLENILIEKFKTVHRHYFETLWKSIKVQEISTPAVEFIGAVVMAGVIFYGSHRASLGLLTSGQLVAFILALGLCQMPIKKLNNAYLKLKIGEAAVERISEILDLEKIDERAGGFTPPQFVNSISFENVSLSYHGKPALNGISFTVRRGEVVALVGPSGGGKSTIINLLPRLYEVSGGRILIDGRDARTMPLGELRSLFSFVTQDNFLFNDSVYENIRYGKPSASKQEIEEAAYQSQCIPFIEKLPEGIDTKIGERGVTLSGGERQRLAIARAILSEAPLLVLDEATSSLDSHSELLVQKAVEALMDGRTTFTVAHRLSSVLRANRILVVEKGKIVETGSHQDLLQMRGLYHGLFSRQLEC